MKKVKVVVRDEKDDYEKIGNIYYDPLQGYTGVEKLYHKLKNSGITRKQIQDFLKKQELYQVNQQPSSQGSFIPYYPLQEFQIDLIYLEDKHLNKASYGFCCIDVFSKKADIELMKKRDEETTIQAMKAILKRMGIPEMIYCDEGSEFNNKGFLALMKENDIEIVFTMRHAPVIERFNRTIKSMLSKYLQASNSKTITNVLPVLLENYNNSYHKTIKMAPNEVNEENIDEVFESIYNASKIVPREEIKVGDKVRVLIKEKAHDKKYKQRWSTDVHTITKISDHYYHVSGSSKRYLRAYLMKVDKAETRKVTPMLEGTNEGHLKALATAQKIPTNQTTHEPLAKTRDKRETKPRKILDL